MHSPPITPNLFAYAVVVLWPLAAGLFYTLRPVVPATLWTILAAQLLLPVGTSFKFEMVPLLDKTSIPNLCALIGCMAVTGRSLRLVRGFGFPEILLGGFLILPIITSLLNSDPVEVGGTVLPGVGLYDGLSTSFSQFILLIPFFLGRQFLRNPRDLQECLEIFAVAGLIYSLPMVFEIRFSPQLHNWIYGYSPSDFIQEMREGGGFRPMVFMGHGLVACFFFMTTVVAAAALWRLKIRLFLINSGALTAYLGTVLVLCKSGAALVYGLVLVPVVAWAKPKLQVRAAIVLAAVALLYPAMRMSEVFPTNTILNFARTVNEPRAHSLEERFDQEEELLQRASQRLWFGWGRFGRNRVMKEDWQGVGTDYSVTDGRWIITLGQFGLFGFFAEFGLLAFPIFRAAAALGRLDSFKETVSIAVVALIISINMIELLPNSTLNPWTWLLTGALLGCSETVLGRKRPRVSQSKIGTGGWSARHVDGSASGGAYSRGSLEDGGSMITHQPGLSSH
jgi:hypothetical protein